MLFFSSAVVFEKDKTNKQKKNPAFLFFGLHLEGNEGTVPREGVTNGES